MDRRAFLRRTAPVLAGGVFVPRFGRWFQHLGRLWAPAPLEAIGASPMASLVTGQGELNQMWRKVQEELAAGYDFVGDEWRIPSLDGFTVYPEPVHLELAYRAVELVRP